MRLPHCLVPSNRFEVLECKAARRQRGGGEQDGACVREAGLMYWRSIFSARRAMRRLTLTGSMKKCAAPRPIMICRARVLTALWILSRPAAMR